MKKLDILLDAIRPAALEGPRPESVSGLTDDSRAVEPGSYTLWVGGGQPDARTAELTGQQVLQGGFVR